MLAFILKAVAFVIVFGLVSVGTRIGIPPLVEFLSTITNRQMTAFELAVSLFASVSAWWLVYGPSR